MSSPLRKIVVLGAGPIGLEAALYGAGLGHDVQVFEGGRVADNVRRWGHVRLFSPWKLNHSTLGVRELNRSSVQLPDDEAYPSGSELVDAYLAPLAQSPLLEGRVHERHRVVQVGREGLGKSDLIGGPRDRFPFRILLDTPSGERIVHGDIVLDCSGTYDNPNWLGNGNIPAPGERRLRRKIAYHLEDIAGQARERYEGRRVLLVGAGHSASAALEALTRLPRTKVVWAVRDDIAEPHVVRADDPLPQRARLSRMANDLARGADPRVEYRKATVVEQIDERGTGFAVSLASEDTAETVAVDRILAHVGYSPDNSIYRELQVHECYATLGPIDLAATLLAQGSTDCMAQKPCGAEALRNPEPGFFILGAKSYGKNSSFLIRIGLEQVREVYSIIESRPELNLYAA